MVEGTPFGRYRLLSLIGEGGMGKVYKAHDTVMGRDVAIKVLPRELASESSYEQRFRREASTAARLTEPHIIPIHDSGEIDGQLYLVMPVIDGVDVKALLDREGPLGPPRAVAVIEQLAAALDAAHAAGLVHRDVKPSNALIVGNDFVYLIDFGIAHDAAATRLTQTGSFVGTVAYMSPERLNTGVADARSDVYALACVLYECLTGALPFPGASIEQQMAAHLTRVPPKPTEIDPAIPGGFDEVIAAGMAKDPEQRYRSAGELAAAARRALGGASVPTPVPSSPKVTARPAPLVEPSTQASPARPAADVAPPVNRSKRNWLIAAAVIVVVAAIGVGVMLHSVLSSPASSELVLTAAADPGANPFMSPAASPPPPNTQPPPTVPAHPGTPVATQALPGDRAGLYGGTLNNAECDRDKMTAFLGEHPAQASAFVDALNSDSTLSWSGGHTLTAADIPTYLRELTPTVLRFDTRVTNHGFDGTHPTTLQSVFQPGTAVFVDARGVPRARCYCGNPLTEPVALTGDPKPVGTPWPGYNPEALAQVQPSSAAITNFVLVDVVTGLPFNRPTGTTGADDTPHDQPVPPPVPAATPATTGQGPHSDIVGTYVGSLKQVCDNAPESVSPYKTYVADDGKVIGVPVNADGSFSGPGMATGNGVSTTVNGTLTTGGGNPVLHATIVWRYPWGYSCTQNVEATRQ
jgi:serine/threonine protein kinase